MNIQNYIKDGTLFIVPTSYKNKILLTLKKLYNIKFMTLEELIKNCTFEYDECAIYYLMKKYHYKYDIAKEYLNNLYYIDDINDVKINKLKKIKKELEKEKLLNKNNNFFSYLKTVNVIIYGYELKKFDIKIIEQIKRVTTVKILSEDKKIKKRDVYEFSNIEEEIIFVATSIIELIKKEVEISNIKIINIDDTYYNPIKRIFKLYHLDIDLNDNDIYSNYKVKQFLKSLEKTKSFNQALLCLDKDSELYVKVVDICNKYLFADIIDQYIIECITEEIKKTKLKSKIQTLKISDIDDYIKPNDYVFFMNFNQGFIPKVSKDEKYLSDYLRKKLRIDTSGDLNKYEKKKIINKINRIENIIITYKLKTPYQVYYKSNLIDELKMNVKKIDIENKYLYSNLYNKIALTKKIDRFIKYNEHENDLDLLYNNVVDFNYSTYNNQFSGINNKTLLTYLNNKLLLSYSSIDNYYRCNFRYYINNILKLSRYEETFAMFIGNLFHYILSRAFSNNFNFELEFNNYIEDKKFSAKEEFFVKKLKEELLFVIDTINKQNELSHFDKELYEEKIYINDDGNIKITFMGIIDKLKYKKIGNKNYVAIIDYKTGTPETNIRNTIYGIEMQLPIYLYLAKRTNKINDVEIVGIYLQKIINKKVNRDINKDYLKEKIDNLKLDGLSINDENILEKFDNTYKDSSLIKSLKKGNNGFYAYSKMLDNNQIDKLDNLVASKIKEAGNEIVNGNFKINPKRIGEQLKGCEFCKYKELCYLKEEDIDNLAEYKDLSFL